MKDLHKNSQISTCIDNFKVQLNRFDEVPIMKLTELCPVFLFCQVDPVPFLKMCLNSRGLDSNDVCVTAVAYLQACLMENTPLRIPDTCVKYAHFFSHQI